MTLRASVEPALSRSGVSGAQGPTGIMATPESWPHHPWPLLKNRSAIAVRGVLVLKSGDSAPIEPEIELGVVVEPEIDRGLQQRAVEIGVGLLGHQPVGRRGQRAELPVIVDLDGVGGIGHRAEADAVAF